MKFSVHPLFVAAGLLCALFGGLPVFAIYTLTALLHECGHIFCAYGMGFYCSKVTLMPYGAAAVCNIDGITARDELKLALAGPAVNAALCVALAGLWWFFPDTYAWTDTVMQANTVMLAINILPAYPLDGGRAARCILCRIMPERAADIILRALTVLFSLTLAVLSVIFGAGFNGVAFCTLLLCAAFTKPVPACKINFAAPQRLKRGLEIRYVLVDEDITYRRALKYLGDKYYVVLRTETGREVSQDELYSGFLSCGIYDRVFQDDSDARSPDETDCDADCASDEDLCCGGKYSARGEYGGESFADRSSRANKKTSDRCDCNGTEREEDTADCNGAKREEDTAKNGGAEGAQSVKAFLGRIWNDPDYDCDE